MAQVLCTRCCTCVIPIDDVCPLCERNLPDDKTLLENELCDLQDTVHSQNAELNELQAKLDELQPRLEFLRWQFDNGQADGSPKSDVVIVVQSATDQPLYAHKIILAHRSSVFRKMFELEMLEEGTGIVRIDDASLPVLRAVIRFCYCAEIDFTHEVAAEDVLPVAHKYAIDLLQKVCEEEMCATINGRNLPRRLKLAKKFQAKGLQARALRYLKRNFDEAIGGVVRELF